MNFGDFPLIYSHLGLGDLIAVVLVIVGLWWMLR